MTSVPSTRTFGLTLPVSGGSSANASAFSRRTRTVAEPAPVTTPTHSRFNLSHLDVSATTTKPKTSVPQPTHSRFNVAHLDISGASLQASAPAEPTTTRTFGALSTGSNGTNPFGNRARTENRGDRGGERTEFSEQAAAAFGKKVRKSDVPEYSEEVHKSVLRMKERNTIWSQISHIAATNTPDAVATATGGPVAATVKSNNPKASAKVNAKKSKKHTDVDDLLDYVPTQHTNHAQYAYSDEEEAATQE